MHEPKGAGRLGNPTGLSRPEAAWAPDAIRNVTVLRGRTVADGVARSDLPDAATVLRIPSGHTVIRNTSA